MENNRLELRDILIGIMEECGEEPKLYYQSPESIKLEYPCIIYKLRTMTSSYADNRPYKSNIGFDITYITRDPTSKVPARIVREPMMGFDRYYTASNLHHYAYTYTNTLKEV